MIALRRFSGALALAALLAASPAFAQTGGKVVAKVDGQDVTEAEVSAAAAEIGAPSPADPQVVDYVIDTRLVAREADKEKIGDDPEIQRKVKQARDKLIMEALLTRVGKAAVTEEAVRKAYDEAAKAQPPKPEVKARHILVPTEDEAKKVIERLKKGEDFATLAKEVSKDPGSPGGELGWFSAERMVPEFSKAAFALEKDKLSEPVKSQFGWHVIQLQDKRTQPFPAFDQVKPQVEKYVEQKAQADYILKLRSAAKIEKIAPVAPPAPPAAPAAPKP